MNCGPTAFEVQGLPKFLIIAKQNLRPEQVHRLQEAFELAFADPTKRAIIFEPGLTVYQWVGGRYRRLDEPAPRPRLLSRIAAVFRP
jgi:hypothetical protein